MIALCKYDKTIFALFWSTNPDGQKAIVSGAIFIPEPALACDTPFSLKRKYSMYSSTTVSVELPLGLTFFDFSYLLNFSRVNIF